MNAKLKIDFEKYLTDLRESLTTLDMNEESEVDINLSLEARTEQAGKWLHSRNQQLTHNLDYAKSDLLRAFQAGYLSGLPQAMNNLDALFKEIKADAQKRYDAAVSGEKYVSSQDLATKVA
jgi:hypothetical protein